VGAVDSGIEGLSSISVVDSASNVVSSCVIPGSLEVAKQVVVAIVHASLVAGILRSVQPDSTRLIDLVAVCFELISANTGSVWRRVGAVEKVGWLRNSDLNVVESAGQSVLGLINENLTNNVVRAQA